MSIKIAKIESHIQKNYQEVLKLFPAFCQNTGYIDGLMECEKVNSTEGWELHAYNQKTYHFKERERNARRNIEKKGELRKMDFGRIGKRINESIDSIYNTVPHGMANINITKIQSDTHKALKIYKELIVRIHDIGEDGAPFRTRRIGECIQELEDKYYPQPKSKTPKEMIDDILNEYLDINNSRRAPQIFLKERELTKALIKLRDEIEEEKPSMSGMGI